MTRVLELLAVVAPVVGVLLLLVYRKRSATAFLWGLAGCVLALGASVVGVFGGRASLLAGLISGEGVDGVIERMEGWTVVRFALLIGAATVLVIGASADRRPRRKPVGWISCGVVLVAGGLAAHLVQIDFGAERERLNAIAGVLLESVEFAMIGIGILLLCVAVTTGRPGHDNREDPAEIARRVGTFAYQVYKDSRRGSR